MTSIHEIPSSQPAAGITPPTPAPAAATTTESTLPADAIPATSDANTGAAVNVTPTPMASSSSAASAASSSSSLSVPINAIASQPALLSPTSLIVEQKVLHTLLLTSGQTLLKYGRSGKPHLDVVKMSTDATKMYWGRKSVPLSELQQVLEGRQSPVFLKYDADAHSGLSAAEMETLSRLSFSLIFASRSLDLQFEINLKKVDQEKLHQEVKQRNAWIQACRWLLDQRAQGKTALAPPQSDRYSSASAPQTPYVSSNQQYLDPSTAYANLHHNASAGSLHTSPASPPQPGASSASSSSPSVLSPPQPKAARSVPASPVPSATAAVTAIDDIGISRPHHVVRTTHVKYTGAGAIQWERERLDADFSLERKLGEGAFAEVWLARHRSLGFEVAVKTIRLSPDPKRAEREKADIRDEIEVLQKCRIGALVGFLGCCPVPDAQNRMWVLMDYCALGSLKTLPQHTGLPYSESEIAYIIHSVLMGLTYLGSRSIVHRDLKAANILVADTGQVALSDFGVSKILHSSSTTPAAGSSHDAHGAGAAAASAAPTPMNIAGSPCFMAPEVIAGATPTFAADIWSLGITCLELANNGRVPHDELPTPFRVMRAIKTSAPPSLAWVPAGEPAAIGAGAPPNHHAPADGSGPATTHHATSPNSNVAIGGSTSGGTDANTSSSNGPSAAAPCWSPRFFDFVSRCLELDPTARADAISLLSHPFVSGAFSAQAMERQVKAYEEAQRKREKRLRKENSNGHKQRNSKSAAPSSKPAHAKKPSILDSLFRLLGRKGPTSLATQSRVEALREGGKLDEMGDAEEVPCAGGGAGGGVGPGGDGAEDGEDGSANGTVVLNGGIGGGSDTTVFATDSGVTSSDEDEADTEVASHVAGDHSSAATSRGVTPTASPSFTPLTGHGLAADLSLPPPHPSTGAASDHSSVASSSSGMPRRRPSLQGDFLIRCSSSQLISIAGEVGLDQKFFQAFLGKLCAKYGTLVPNTSHPSGKKGKPINTPGARRAQTQQAGEDDDPDSRSGTPLPAVNLFPGCTPSADAESYIAALEMSTVNVCALSRNDLTSLKRMTNAPPPVRMAIESVALILGVKPILVSGAASKKGGGKIKAVWDYWTSAQAVLTKPTFLTLLKSYDFTRSLSPEIIDRLAEFAMDKPPNYTPEVVEASSVVAGTLWAWTRSIYAFAVHAQGYTPEPASDQPNALTVKAGDPASGPPSMVASSSSDKLASSTSNLTSPNPRPGRRVSQSIDPATVAAEIRKPLAHRRGSGAGPHCSYPTVSHSEDTTLATSGTPTPAADDKPLPSVSSTDSILISSAPSSGRQTPTTAGGIETAAATTAITTSSAVHKPTATRKLASAVAGSSGSTTSLGDKPGVPRKKAPSLAPSLSAAPSKSAVSGAAMPRKSTPVPAGSSTARATTTGSTGVGSMIKSSVGHSHGSNSAKPPAHAKPTSASTAGAKKTAPEKGEHKEKA